MYLLQASVLTKLFLPEWHFKCLEDPKTLFDTRAEPFRVRIPRAVGAIELYHNKPVLASSLLAYPEGVKKTREVTDDEVSPLVEWLTNPQNSETHQWGVVEIKVERDIADTIMAMLYEGKTEEREDLLKKSRERMGKAIQEARLIADERVMQMCGKIYSTVKSTVEHMKKNNIGVYSPSYAEALAMTVMKDQISAHRVPNDRASAMMNAAIGQMVQPA
jgi:preprotein translocase subunit SecD